MVWRDLIEAGIQKLLKVFEKKSARIKTAF